MKAAADAQARLLDLQAADLAIAQVEHRRRTLPELAEIEAGKKERVGVLEDFVKVRTRVSDLQTEQKKAEADLVPVRERLARDQKRVDSGAVTDHKALRGLLDEIEHLKGRISDLEDIELDVMERLEASQGEFADITQRKEDVENRLRALIAKREASFAELDAELAECRNQRNAVAATVQDDLRALYEKIAAKSQGIGAALLRQGVCGACRIQLNSTDLDRIAKAPADEVLRCEGCGAILVRTEESGL